MARDGTYGQAGLDRFPLMDDASVQKVVSGMSAALTQQFAMDTKDTKVDPAAWLYRYNRAALAGYDTLYSLTHRPAGAGAARGRADRAQGARSDAEAKHASGQEDAGNPSSSKDPHGSPSELEMVLRRIEREIKDTRSGHGPT